MSIATEYIAFPSRESRTQFVARRFARYLREGSVLDVGCFEAPLRALLPRGSYTGVDMVGNPDVVLDLDQAERLPFADNAFSCVICIDVLEHLDTLHSIFAELIRVSSQHVIISLPNCWCDARRPLARGRGHFGHYGLPLQKPKDRHKWFFSLSEAHEFVQGKAAELGLLLDDLFVTEKPRHAVLTMVRRAIYSGSAYQNRYSGTLWAVLRKPAPDLSPARRVAAPQSPR